MRKRPWFLALMLGMGSGAAGTEPGSGGPRLERPALDVRILRDGELALVRLVGGTLRIDSPLGARARELTAEERQRLLAASAMVAAKGKGALSCEREEMYVYLRLDEEEASGPLCQGGRPEEAAWRRLLELLRQLATAKAEGRT